MNKRTAVVVMHIIFFIYVLAAVSLKIASGESFMSFKFIIYYGISLCSLAVYSFAWQQILNVLPLSVAFSNKAVTIIWGMLLGYLIFAETISLRMVFGAAIIVIGMLLVVRDGE